MQELSPSLKTELSIVIHQVIPRSTVARATSLPRGCPHCPLVAYAFGLASLGGPTACAHVPFGPSHGPTKRSLSEGLDGSLEGRCVAAANPRGRAIVPSRLGRLHSGHHKRSPPPLPSRPPPTHPPTHPRTRARAHARAHLQPHICAPPSESVCRQVDQHRAAMRFRPRPSKGLLRMCG